MGVNVSLHNTDYNIWKKKTISFYTKLSMISLRNSAYQQSKSSITLAVNSGEEECYKDSISGEKSV